MAVAPTDPRHPDLTASDVLSPQTWPRRGLRPTVGLDVICTKIAVDFQSMTAQTAVDTIAANLDLLREAARADAAFHAALDTDGATFIDVQVSRLRKIIEPDPANPIHIQTVWGFGYVFVPDDKSA